MSEADRFDRRRFIGTAVTAIASAGLLAFRLRAGEPWGRDALGPIKRTHARILGVRYAEAGASNGPAAILLRRESGDVSTDIASLAERGYRVIVPRAVDAAPSEVLALMAALKIEKALVSGRGESARTAEALAARWPRRFKHIAPPRGSDVVTLAASQQPLPPHEELAWWYQYYFIRKGEA